MKPSPPIELAINTSHLLMEGLHGVLELQVENTGGDAIVVTVEVSGRLVPRGITMCETLAPGASARRCFDLPMLARRRSDRTMAGAARFEVAATVETGATTACVAGDFTLTVLEYATTRNEINVHIERVVDHRGDNAGMGAINEIDLGDLVRVPETVGVNELLSQERPARFVGVPLRPVAAAVGGSATPDALRLVNEATGACTTIFSSDRITLGRSRSASDLVTCHLPRSAENDRRSRRISSAQCILEVRGGGAALVPLDSTNPTRLDGVAVTGTTTLSTDRPSTLGLPGDLTLLLTPIAAAGDRAAAPLGAVLLTRADAPAERALWLLDVIDAHVLAEDAAAQDVVDRVPRLRGGPDPAVQLPGEETWSPLIDGPPITVGTARWRVEPDTRR